MQTSDEIHGKKVNNCRFRRSDPTFEKDVLFMDFLTGKDG